MTKSKIKSEETFTKADLKVLNMVNPEYAKTMLHASELTDTIIYDLKKLDKSFDPVKEKEEIRNIEYLSYGLPNLDLRLGGGYPVSRISEIIGLEGSGKSTLGFMILKQTLDSGGIAILIDTENAIEFSRLEILGLDAGDKRFLYKQLSTLEEIYSYLDRIINSIYEDIKNKPKGSRPPITIVIDSLAAASTKKEIESDIDSAEMAERARINSKALRRLTVSLKDVNASLIFINQLRDKMNMTGFGGPEFVSPGGKAVKYHATHRLLVKNLGQIKDADKNVLGNKLEIRTIKNKTAPPMQKTIVVLFYKTGYNEAAGIFEELKEFKAIYSSGPLWKIKGIEGVEIPEEFKTFKKSDWETIVYPALKDLIFSTPEKFMKTF